MDEQYLQTVASRGDLCKVIITQAICAIYGIKFVDKDVCLPPFFIDRLVRQKIKPTLDQCLDINEAKTKESQQTVVRFTAHCHAWWLRK